LRLPKIRGEKKWKQNGDRDRKVTGTVLSPALPEGRCLRKRWDLLPLCRPDPAGSWRLLSVNREKAVLAIIEEGLMEDGIIPNKHEKKFEMAFLEEILKREGIVPRKGGPDVTKK
jgi:hypothetical protein